jgi:DNA-binding transcriptional LysR family regulator
MAARPPGKRHGATVIDKFEFLIALARERHFGRAAEACGVTQPTLSAGVRSLEDAFGLLLVNRGSRFIGFTPEGERVLDWARRIVGDARAMRQEIHALKHGLAGHLRIASVPTALGFVPALTAPYLAHHPQVRFTVQSKTSIEVLTLLENLEVDAGLTYVDNEPLGRVRSLPLFRERYCLVTTPSGPLGDREKVTWADVGTAPLCLLTPDMQNRRIVDSMLRGAGVKPAPALESNSVILLITHVRTGSWATVLAERLAATLGFGEAIRSIPIVGPSTGYTIGLVAPEREPMMPLTAALFAEARKLVEPFEP